MAIAIFAMATSQIPQSPPSAPEAGKAGVTVSVAVTDHDHHPVPGLKAEDFVLYENGQPQQISAVSSDVPACMGLLVDNSGSMRSKGAKIRAALVDFIQAGNPEDRVFVVNFNDEPYLDQNFTRDRALIQEALRRFDPRGGTALYDSLIATAGHLAKARGCRKKVLVLVSDGRDNESRKSLSQTIKEIRTDNGVVIYAIALPENDASFGRPSAHKVLEDLTAATGGKAFFAGNLGKVFQQAAEEIRGQYVINYTAGQFPEGISSQLKIEVRAPGHKDLVVRTSSEAKAEPQGVALDQPSSPDQPSVGARQMDDSLAAQARFPGCIAGTVLDGEKKSLPGTRVETFPTFDTNSYPKNAYPSALTNERGEFRIRGLVPGEYRLYTGNQKAGYPSTSLPFYQDREVPAALATEECTNTVIMMGPKAATLRVNVIAAGTLAPLPTSGVWLQKGSGQKVGFMQHAQTRDILVPADSEFTMTVVSYPGYLKSEAIAVRTLGPGTSQNLTVTLQPSGTPSTASKPNQ
jgi:VWFA-related protein